MKRDQTFALAAPETTQQGFDKVKISIASPDQIRSWSYGVVKKPETINYRTFKPEKDGLFCARIFGPVKDYECLCGKYKRMKHRGVICEKCGVEVTSSKVRRDRMGHIELASPVAHIWFAKSLPSRIGTLLDLNTKNLDRILYFEGNVVIDPGLTELEYGQIMSDEELDKAQQDYGKESFRVGAGAEAIKEMLAELNLSDIRVKLREELSSDMSELKRKKIIKRLKLVEAFLSSGTRPEWMVLDVIPVMPPDLRPLVPLDVGRFATADLNDLYRRLINRNNRLKRLMDLNAPDMIIRNEKRMLQEIVDAFFDNGRRGRPILGANKRPLKSLSDLLKGKTGRFRMNLLGKRVDYSARSVIVVGADLKLHQCGLPENIALEIFKPFIYAKLAQYGFAPTIKVAKAAVERRLPEVMDVLEEVVQERLVLLNRAPTLHKLGIQAFEPKLVKGKAIQLHPLVCAAFNADFDGDQMAVHVPLSIEAQTEARVLMMSTNNILSPANGYPVIVPTKDIVLGMYYLTMSREGMAGEGRVFACENDVLAALEAKVVTLHSKIKVRVSDFEGEKRFDTTPGRIIFWDIFPKNERVIFSQINRCITSKDMFSMIDDIYRHCGQKDTIEFVDKLVQLGFKYATISGVSFGKDDLVVPESKGRIVDETKKIISEYHNQYMEGLITNGERYNKVTDAWMKCTEKISEDMMKGMTKDVPGVGQNSVFVMMNSGARGSAVQMRQLAAMRGLIAKHDGSILENPIISNLKEGQTAGEAFSSTKGARKGLADTALKTAGAGYLTRRLVDVAQDCVISTNDCGTQSGLMMQAIIEGEEVISSLADRILGRVAVDDVTDAAGNMICKACELIDEQKTDAILEAGIELVRCRSVLTCEAEQGICALCYGRDLSRRKLVTVGEAVGIIAAQSIGEPGTQLTLRTFHSGGAAQHASEISFVEASAPGVIRFKNKQMLHGAKGQVLVMSRHMELMIQDDQGKDIALYRLPYGASLFVNEGDKVDKGQKLVEWDPYTIPIIAECDGVVHYVDLIEGVSLREFVDEASGSTKRVVTNWQKNAKSKSMQPKIVLRNDSGDQIKASNGADARYLLSQETTVLVENKAGVRTGDIIAKISKESIKSRDIVGGLPRIAELFEARIPKDPAIISECDGYIQYGKDYKTRRRVSIVPEDQSKHPIEYVIPKGKQFLVQEGEFVQKGDVLVDGNLVPHDILRIMGVEALAFHLIKEIQDVYRMQGVRINDKHIETIVRQMLRKLEIIDAGDTLFLMGDHVDRDEFEESNAQAEKEGKLPASARPVLQGITRASLQTKSFISAASFQETTRVLIEAAVRGKRDDMIGLKENIIAGSLIPAGTGFIARELKKEAADRDEKLYAEYLRERKEREEQRGMA